MSRATVNAAKRARRARREYEAAGAAAGCAETAELTPPRRPFDPTDLYLLFGYWSRWTRVRGRVAQARMLATSEDPVDRAIREGIAFAGGAPTGVPTPDADYLRLTRRAEATPRRRGRAAVAIAMLLGASGVPRSRGPR